MSTDKFCLRWNDFESNISVAFRELREDKDFFDVTLACDDQQIQAHKVILSACSPFFRSVLKRNPHAHPLLYLRGVKYTDLLAVLNFMYHGEVNVAQEELNSFLAVAEELKVKGLTQSDQGGGSKPSPYHAPAPRPKPAPRVPERELQPPPQKRPRPPPEERAEVQEVVMPPQVKSEPMGPGAMTPLVEMGYEEEGMEEYGAEYGDSQAYDQGALAGAEGNKERYDQLQEFIRSNTGSGNICLLCGKSCTKLHAVQYHIESAHGKHFNVTYNCEMCNKQIDTKNAYITHKSRNHKKLKVVGNDGYFM